MDGTIVIGTKLDTKQLEKQLKQEERRLQQFQKEGDKLGKIKIKTETEEKSSRDWFIDYKHQLSMARKEYNRLLNTPNPPNNAITNQAKLIEKLKGEVNKTQEEWRKNMLKVDDINRKIKENAKNQAIMRGLVGRTNDELGKSRGFNKIKDVVKDIGKETERNIKKVGRYVLAIFGIRAVYSFIRNSINTITANDEQLKADIDYMKTALAYMIEPAVRKIVEWAKVLFQYVAYIIKMWTGQDIFASADKNLKKANKSAKELRKQLAGFDEANVLSDTSSKDKGSATPSFKALGEGEVPKWLEWIGKHAPEILAIVAGIVTALTLAKLGVEALMATGIGVAVAGILLTIIGIINYLKDPTLENFGKVLIGIGIAVSGVAIAFGAWPVAIGGAVIAVVGLIIKNWDKIKKLLDDGINWLKGLSDTIHNDYGDLIGGIYDMFVNYLEVIIRFFDDKIQIAKKIFGGIIDFIAGVFTGDWDRAWNGIFSILEGLLLHITAPFRLAFDLMISIASTAIKTIVNIFSGGFDSIGKALSGALNFALKILDLLWSGFKFNLNLIIEGINFLIHGMNKIQWDVPSWVPLIGGQKWGVNIPKIPKLAQGGIVNMPNKGVMVGGAIAGESGREGVIPLTDPTAMSMLGQEIARYVNISNAVEVNMDSRRISRIMQQSQINNDFARNM